MRHGDMVVYPTFEVRLESDREGVQLLDQIGVKFHLDWGGNPVWDSVCGLTGVCWGVCWLM